VIDVLLLAMSFAAARVTPTLRVAALAPWLVVTALVVTPVSIVTVHLSSALMSAAAAVSVSVAVAVVDLLPATVNVVVPHPSFTGDDSVPIVNVGSTSATVSACFRGAFNSKEYEIDDAAHGTGRAIVRLLCVSAGLSTCVDDPMATALIVPDTDGSVAPTVRVASPAVCATLLLVTPLPTVTVHCSYASSVAVAAVRVSVAVLVVDLLAAAVNVVVPHLFAVTPVMLPNVNVGSTRVIASVVGTSGVFRANMNAMAVGPSVTGFSIVSTACWNTNDVPDTVTCLSFDPARNAPEWVLSEEAAATGACTHGSLANSVESTNDIHLYASRLPT
jgi:hypothetical protein